MTTTRTIQLVLVVFVASNVINFELKPRPSTRRSDLLNSYKCAFAFLLSLSLVSSLRIVIAVDFCLEE